MLVSCVGLCELGTEKTQNPKLQNLEPEVPETPNPKPDPQKHPAQGAQWHLESLQARQESWLSLGRHVGI